MANRLAAETSPYLQQHAENPVDWDPRGTEALERARREDRPILLAIGDSACHWCHLMAHESFEDPAVAQVMNRLFVNVKVDREERPDLDQIYQTAHQMLAQRPGGWPLTMFLTPDGAPFFGGNYFPKQARYGMPAFADLCERIAELWHERRADIGAQNEQVLQAFARTVPSAAAQPAELSPEVVRAMLDNLRANFDAALGGFGRAPKFPHPTDLELGLREGEKDMALVTLERMCEGGIYDQLGGGFCRYSVDAHWTIPHFEKMLYDNGPLLGLLADAWLVARVFGRHEWLRSARRALDFIRGRMWRDGKLLATYKDGRAHLNAYLDDYAFLIAALLELMQAEFAAADLEFATQLADVLRAEFEDREAGGFYFTGTSHGRLFHRPKPGQDQAMPAGNAIAAWSLGRLAALTGEARYARAAERTAELFYPQMRDYPAGWAAMSIALSEQLAPPKLVVLRGRGEELVRWRDELAREYLPDTMVLALPDGMPGLPATLDKPRRAEAVDGWLCRGVMCLEPMSDLIQLKTACKEKS